MWVLVGAYHYLGCVQLRISSRCEEVFSCSSVRMSSWQPVASWRTRLVKPATLSTHFKPAGGNLSMTDGQVYPGAPTLLWPTQYACTGSEGRLANCPAIEVPPDAYTACVSGRQAINLTCTATPPHDLPAIITNGPQPSPPPSPPTTTVGVPAKPKAGSPIAAIVAPSVVGGLAVAALMAAVVLMWARRGSGASPSPTVRT